MNVSSLLSLVHCVFQGFTDRTLNVLSAAISIAAAEGQGQVSPEHLLLAVAKGKPAVGFVVLEGLGVILQQKIAEIETLVSAIPAKNERNHAPSFSPETKLLLAAAKSESKALGHPYVGTEHLLLGFVKCGEGPASDYLRQNGVTHDRLREQILKMLGGGAPMSGASM